VDLHQFLARLAVIEPVGASLGGQASSAGMQQDVHLRELGLGDAGEYHIVLTAKRHGSLPTSWWNCSYFVFLGAESSSSRSNQ
jgi:hypothetical protein